MTLTDDPATSFTTGLYIDGIWSEAVETFDDLVRDLAGSAAGHSPEDSSRSSAAVATRATLPAQCLTVVTALH